MIKSWFYTFLQTKHQEESNNSRDPNYPLFPQEIEIRPIAYFPWEILKTLTTDEIISKFQLPMEKIRDTMLRHASEEDIYRTKFMSCETNILVKDLDTNTIHQGKLWKHPCENNFALCESWIEEFVKRRRLVVGMVVGMYWDFEACMFCFSVLDGRQ
ncbi:unnamed protein product [Arabidopsis thaliana]|uniref:Uncharacterized protein n=1 Tax=Arabidopsis thaliana TaxID=3702 RepID=A0A654G4C4_ARATH|nr:unnamed protein product [Arabidopsis thaliana]